MIISKIENVSQPTAVRKKQITFKSCSIEDSFHYSSPTKKQLQQLKNTLSFDSFNSEAVLHTFEEIKRLSPKQKKEFIDLYCEQTGFPDMQKTSALIVNNVKKALCDAAKKTNVNVLLAGYNPTCSAANGHALPGSDFDTFFICLENWNNADNFKNEFKRGINPLLCSMIYQRTNDLPDFVVIDDIKSSMKKAQNIFDEQGLKDNADIYGAILDEQIADWTCAGKYNLDVNRFIEDEDKTPLLRAGLLMEIYRDGEVIEDNLDEETRDIFTNSCVYKYSNMQQMRSYQQAPLKQKHLNRKRILGNFQNLNDDEKLDLIFNIIKLSVKDLKKNVSEKYSPMFRDAGCGNMEDLIQPLLSSKHRIRN